MMPNDPVVGGNVLRRPAIESPNFVPGVSGWAINADGTAQFNQLTLIVQTSGAAVLIYGGTAAPGTLIGSWASAAGVDQYGNSFPAGLFANQGLLQGVLLTNPQIVGATILSSILTGPQVTAAAISGGTMTETAITFDSTGGSLLVYTSSTTTVTQTVANDYTITFPAGVTSADVSCWGADGGGDGGSTVQGGVGAGGGGFARTQNYPVTPGTYTYTVGAGGQNGVTGSAGQDGGYSFFDNGGVYAGPGSGGGGIGGSGGTDNFGTITHNGGNGGGDGTQSSGGCGAGGRAVSTGNGGNGAKSTTSAGAVGGSAGSGTGGHTGGSGGASGGNGSASGGGAGAGSAVTNINKVYQATSSAAYFGSDASSGAPPNGKRNSTPSNGTMYQGGETAGGGSFNGTQKGMAIWPQSTIAADFAGATIDSITLRLSNIHSWFNSGMSLSLGYTNNGSLPATYSGGATFLGTFTTAEGQTKNYAMPKSYATALVAGTAKSLVMGPGPGSFNLNYYGYFYGAQGASGNNPQLTITGHVGAGSNAGGLGVDGQVTIVYTSGTVLGAAVAPVAGTDPNGNAYAAGFTGQIQAFHPASSPTVVETWQATPALNVNFSKGSPAPFYKLNADNTVSLTGIVNVVSGTTSGVVFTLPTGYQAITVKKFPLAFSGGTPATAANAQITVQINGDVQLSAGPTAAAYSFTLDPIRYSLDV